MPKEFEHPPNQERGTFSRPPDAPLRATTEGARPGEPEGPATTGVTPGIDPAVQAAQAAIAEEERRLGPDRPTIDASKLGDDIVRLTAEVDFIKRHLNLPSVQGVTKP